MKNNNRKITSRCKRYLISIIHQEYMIIITAATAFEDKSDDINGNDDDDLP